LLLAVITASTTWITPVRGRCKRIVPESEEGDQTAMTMVCCHIWPQVASDGRPRGKTPAQEGRSNRSIVVAAKYRGCGAGGPCRDQNTTPLDEDPEFQAAYREARRGAFGQAIARLQQGSSAAVTTLLKLMLDPATPPSVRARCCEAILSLAIKAIELEDIESRLAALERATEASKDTRRFA
jgi:hypothetical protein